MKPFIVLLSGPITGLTYKEGSDWREFAIRSFPPHIQGISPLRGQRYLQGAGKIQGTYPFVLSTSRAMNARCHFDLLRSNAVLVNLIGASEVSIGTVAEMAWAYDHRIPVVCAIEPEGNVHDHPMLQDWIDYRVSSLDEAIEAVTSVVSLHDSHMWTRTEEMHMLQDENRLDLQAEPLKTTYVAATGLN